MKICVFTDRGVVMEMCARAAESVACSTTFRDGGPASIPTGPEDWDLVVLDKATSGALELLPSLRRDSAAFIICLVDNSMMAEMSRLIEAGADMIVLDVVSPKELKAHFLAVSRHKGARALAAAVRFGEFTLNRALGLAYWRGQRIDFGSQHIMFTLFALLLDHADECVSHKMIWREVWANSKLEPNRETIQRTVWRLRRLLRGATGHDHVRTVRGDGYRFSVDDAPAMPEDDAELDNQAQAFENAGSKSQRP